MRSSVSDRFNRWDALVAVGILLAAAACAALFYLPAAADGALCAIVRADGAEIDRFPLSGTAQKRYTSRGYTLEVSVSDGTLRVLQADCPSQDCVHTGAIGRAGESIVCLPARISIQLAGDGGASGGDVDAVIG